MSAACDHRYMGGHLRCLLPAGHEGEHSYYRRASDGASRPVLVEYRGQLVTGRVIRSFGFMRRVQLDSTGGYFLRWLPSWRVTG